MPSAKRRRRDALNQAYAYVVSPNFDETARQLRDGLVEGAGFNRLEADEIVTRQDDLGFDPAADTIEHRSEPVVGDGISAQAVESAIGRLPEAVRSRVSFDKATGTVVYRGPMTKENRNRLQLALAASPRAGRVVDRLYAKSNNFSALCIRRRRKASLCRANARISHAGRAPTLHERTFPRSAVATRQV